MENKDLKAWLGLHDNDAEVKCYVKIGDEEKTPGILLGKTLDSDEIITLPDDCKSLNRNVMIWGA